MEKHFITYPEIYGAAVAIADRIIENNPDVRDGSLLIYAVPRGGIPAAYAVAQALIGVHYADVQLTENLAEADIIIDDLIDSGRTLRGFEQWCPRKPFFALFDKSGKHYPAYAGSELPAGSWVVFPWEARHDEQQDDTIVGTLVNRILDAGDNYFANDNISRHVDAAEIPVLEAEVAVRMEGVLRALLIDTVNDHNTQGTAKRVAKMFVREIFAGRYLPAPKLTAFPNAKKLDEMVLTGPITIRSTCSHHFAPITGHCWIGILPGDKVLGLSKFNRIVEWIASRPQIQEEMVVQIADAIEEALQPLGLAVVVKAQHHCMTHRGVKEHGDAAMTTSITRGLLRDSEAARSEFLTLLNQRSQP